MSDLIIPRRQFIIGLVGLFAAPAIVRASSLMPIKALDHWLPTVIVVRDPLATALGIKPYAMRLWEARTPVETMLEWRWES